MEPRQELLIKEVTAERYCEKIHKLVENNKGNLFGKYFYIGMTQRVDYRKYLERTGPKSGCYKKIPQHMERQQLYYADIAGEFNERVLIKKWLDNPYCLNAKQGTVTEGGKIYVLIYEAKNE